MQDLVDHLVRLADRAGGADVAALPEPIAHIAAFGLVMLSVVVSMVVVGMMGRGLAAFTDGAMWAHHGVTFPDMVRHCELVARWNWWATRAASLVHVRPGPAASPSSSDRLPDRRPTWVRLVARGIHVVTTTLKVSWSAARMLAAPSPVTLFAWVVVITYLDRDVVHHLGPHRLLDSITTNWGSLPGAITVAGAALGVLLAIRRSRLRAVVAHRLASEQACISALSRMLDSLRVARDEMWHIGTHAVPNLQRELGVLVTRVSTETCRINEQLSVELVRRPQHFPGSVALSVAPRHFPAGVALPLDRERLEAAVASIERERKRLDRQGQLPTLSSLLGPTGHRRDEPLRRPAGMTHAVGSISPDAMRELVDRAAPGLETAIHAFAQARTVSEPDARRRLEVEGAIQLELSVSHIVSSYRRELAAFARQVAEVNELHFRLRRRLRLRRVDRALMS